MQSVTWLLLMGTLGYGVRVEAAQGKGVVTAERVNLRTRASLYDSQAFAKVNTGDSLVILEQIEVNSPSSEGLSQWLRVGVPKHIPLWISSKYVDKPSGSVTVNRLNIRVGPGVEHQVIGQLMQGDVITSVKEAGDWVGIEPPEQAVAYIASQFVELQTPKRKFRRRPRSHLRKTLSFPLAQRRPSSSSTILKEKAVRCCRQRFQAISPMIVQALVRIH